MKEVHLPITTETKKEDIDIKLREVYRSNYDKHSIVLNWDLCNLHFIQLKKFVHLKSVLDKYRNKTNYYVDHSVIYVRNKFHKVICSAGTKLCKPERPYYIIVQH